MEIDRADYNGREQAYVKHHFLANYMEQLVLKVASSYNSFVYVDGFSGPWQNQNEDFADTSFGIALKAMRNAKEIWKAKKNHDVRMKAILVERDLDAYQRLQAIKQQYPDIEIKTINGEFVNEVPTIMAGIPARAFSFLLLDPKGWKINMEKVKPLIARPNCEVLLNFMFDFINRFASSPQQAIVDGLRELLPETNWEDGLKAISKDDAKRPFRKGLSG